MDKLLIDGGGRLEGAIDVSGAKNAALPILCAALLTAEPVVLTNVPRLNDVRTMQALLGQMGVAAERDNGTLTLSAASIDWPLAPYELVKTMRASILTLGPLLARCGEARISLPGGCAIGLRPVDQHVKGLVAMGAEIDLDHGYIDARARRLVGTKFVFDLVTGTGTDRIVVTGVESLGGTLHSIMPDRIETGTFLTAAAAAGGEVSLRGARPATLEAVLEKLVEAGVEISVDGTTIRIARHSALKSVNLRTAPYPGFPTDMQAQLMALMTIADDTAVITETIFENRMMHVQELKRLGAEIEVESSTAIIKGVPRLTGANVMATDLRASACLVIAG